MRTVYLGHNLGYAAVCNEESELLAVFWHSGSGNLAVRTGQVLEYCREHGIASVRHDRLDNVTGGMIAALSPDLIVIGEYHNMLKKNIIDIPRYGAINMHGAPLPRYRGAHPINWMIINGEREGAVTCHYVSEGLDSGDIIGQYFFGISETETAYDVRPKIEETGCRLLRDVLQRFSCEGKLTGTPQDEAQALYTPPRKPEDGLIDWRQTPKCIYDFVRALTRPYPGAFAMHKGHKVHIWKVAQPEDTMVFAERSSRPGTVLSVNEGGMEVAVIGGRIMVLDWDSEAVIGENDYFNTVVRHSDS